jgi:hypothetical protein
LCRFRSRLRQVSLVERDAIASAKIGSDDIVVAIQIDCAPGTAIPGLRTRAVFSRINRECELVQFLDAGSSSPPPKGVKATPMVAAAEANSQETTAPEGVQQKWIDSLPTVRELENAGKTRCNAGTCGWRYAYLDEDRYWRVFPPRAGPLSIGSLPLRAE